MPRAVLFAVGVFLILVGFQCRYIKSFTFEVPKYAKSEAAVEEDRTWILEPKPNFMYSAFMLGTSIFFLGLTKRTEKTGKGRD
ncbi:MAG: hypothetical protein J6A23_11155 [Thermoguttaceae bacterium]|nr:hypothetical protein [Thermoguttaceae bacterium]MBP3692895.1 hypothetical protein [Thermoguttaceae bacterium]